MTAIPPVQSPTAAPAPGSARAKLQEAAHQLESVFYGQLFQAMRATVPEGGVVTRDSGESTFTAMLDDKFAQLASNQTTRGLAGAIYRELSRRLPPEATAAPAAANAIAPVTARAVDDQHR